MTTKHRAYMDKTMAPVAGKRHDMAKREPKPRATHNETELQQWQDAEERTNPSIGHEENHNITHCMTALDEISKRSLYLETGTGVLEQGLNL